MSISAPAGVRPVTYPARPINGGPFELAPPKPGQWCYEPKYNGWRALVHAPTGAMFNRYGGPLSIAGLFAKAVSQLRRVAIRVGNQPVEWFDCEALARRHSLGQGTLLVFDYMVIGSGQTLIQRKAVLAEVLAAHDYTQPPESEELYGVHAHAPENKTPAALYRELKQLNAAWGCGFYEGVVAKRTRDAYPVQLRSAREEFVGWIKHRWA